MEAFGGLLQSDGKIVAIAFSFSIMALVRYNTDGSLDRGFGVNGTVITKLTAEELERPYGVLLQPDGKIIAVGEALTNGSGGIILGRYNIDGSLDASFGFGGVARTDIPGFGGQFHGVALQQGRIFVAGRIGTFNGDFAIVCFSSNGFIDPSFGFGGISSTDFFGLDDAAQAISIQSDGKIVAVGYSTFGSGSGLPHIAVARYDQSGSIDSVFGSGGRVVDTESTFGIGRAVVVQQDGKIVVTGTSGLFGLLRYNVNGTLDLSFNAKGTLDLHAGIASLAVQADNKIIGAGGQSNSDASVDFLLTRYNGESFDFCVEDDANGSSIMLNSVTGDYRFTNCPKKITVTGRGTVSSLFCKLQLADNQTDRTLTVSINSCTRVGSASLKSFSLGKTFIISDSNMGNNTCACR